STLQVQACAGTDFVYQGSPIPAGTAEVFTFINAAGCDSLVTVEVESVEALETNLTLATCEGTSIDYNGTLLQPGQDTVFTFESNDGCDSLVFVAVETLLPSAANIELEACSGESISFEGQLLLPGDSLILNLTNSAGCDSTVSVVVNELQNPTVSVTTEPACPGTATGELRVLSNPGITFEYNLDGLPVQTSPEFDNLNAGNYAVTVTNVDNGCSTIIEAEIGAQPSLEAELAINNGTCESPITTVGAIILSGGPTELSYNWSNNITEPVAQFDAPGAYSLTLSNNCEAIVIDFEVNLLDIDSEQFIYIPSAFSPNGDGTNDQFMIFPAPGMVWQSYELMIFDRWGNQMFEGNDPLAGWDGVFRGSLMNTGLYVYHVKGRVNYCGQELDVEREGEVMLVR
ncbi:MAG: gliding motility-associated C-terminal domain-containing protein, partial [Phaeodactylibacter sp.]|nr:gliding motility-associated C-terminal domain-containing protein [Phaeodactylibacter sp.]